MRLLLDACIGRRTLAALLASGHDVVWVGEWPEDPGDGTILESAHADGRVLVTLDKDFGELAVRYQQPHAGIVRLVNWSPEEQAQACIQALTRYQEELENGALVTAEPGRIRVRA